MEAYLEFQKSLAEIDGKAQELRALDGKNRDVSTESEAEALEEKSSILMKQLYSNLTPWNKCQVARHPSRPHALDYIRILYSSL